VLSLGAFNVQYLFSGVAGVDIVKDVAGSGVYWPAFGINSIGNLQSGRAYYVRMNSAGSINFGFKRSDPTEISNYKPISTPWNEVVYTPASHLVAFNATYNAFQTGDVVGGFTPEGWCAGAAEVADPSAPFALNLNSDDIYSSQKDGFETGNPLNYKLYRRSTGETFNIGVNYNPNLNPGFYENNGISEVTAVKMSSTGIKSTL